MCDGKKRFLSFPTLKTRLIIISRLSLNDIYDMKNNSTVTLGCSLCRVELGLKLFFTRF